MSLLDALDVMSTNDNLAQSAGTYLSSKSIDLWAGQATLPTDVFGNAAIIDPGRSNVKLLCQVTTTFTSGGSATLQAQLVMADNAALSTNLVVLESSDVIALATLAAGYQFRFGSLPPGITKRYLGMQYVIGTAAMTAGNIYAALVLNRSTVSIG